MFDQDEMIKDRESYADWTMVRPGSVAGYTPMWAKYFSGRDARGFVFIVENRDMKFICSFGPDSDWSMSGILRPYTKYIECIEDAKVFIDKAMRSYMKEPHWIVAVCCNDQSFDWRSAIRWLQWPNHTIGIKGEVDRVYREASGK